MGSVHIRAAHVRDDAPPWILEDRVAATLLTPDEAAWFDAEMATWPPAVAAGFRTSHAVRARVAEDVAVAGLATDRRDYVLLGAGGDTFAWRHPRAAEFSVYEVDHPDTQAWKRAAIRRAGLPEPGNVTFLAADLATTPMTSLPLPTSATWNWIGVTMYLERAAVEATLQAIATGATGTTLVTNFALADSDLDTAARATRAVSTAAVAHAGEPLTSAFTAREAEWMLRTAGFHDVTMLDARALRDRYLGGRDDVCLPGSTIMAVAVV